VSIKLYEAQIVEASLLWSKERTPPKEARKAQGRLPVLAGSESLARRRSPENLAKLSDQVTLAKSS